MKNRSTMSFLLMLTTLMSTSPSYAKTKYPNIYPFKPMDKEEINQDVAKITEDPKFIKNFRDMVKNNLSEARTNTKPWTSSYWPLAKGTIADPYENSTVIYYTDFLQTHKNTWRTSKKNFDKRVENVLKKIDSLTEEELSQLAPSEKYDLLLGDKNFTLTKQLMDDMYQYGRDNYYLGVPPEIIVSSKDTVIQAENYASWGWVDSEGNPYGDADGALRRDMYLNKRLEVQRGIRTYEAGLFPTLAEAVAAEIDQAQKEAPNYVIADRKLKNIAGWEGICNGWSTAAGIIPRPTNSVSIQLPDGRNLKFYPDDIKGLVSQYWINSFIQKPYFKNNDGTTFGGTLSVGLRCNLTKMKKDNYGRYYDHKDDPKSLKREPRCVGVHPAKWHMGLVNLIGVQGRSFVVERKVKDPVDNHPMYRYEMKYFNPNDGKGYSKDLEDNIVKIDKNDQFYEYRHPEAVEIVGVETTMVYLDYVKPRREETNSDKDDAEVSKKMIYDLELDKDGHIVGGQWRATYVGRERDLPNKPGSRIRQQGNHNQPDFFWAVTKDWKKTNYFNNNTNVSEWKNTSLTPPKDWLAESNKWYTSFSEKLGKFCKVKNKNTNEETIGWCNTSWSKPQPLPNVVNKLMELSNGTSFKDL